MALEMIGFSREEPHSQRFPPGFGLLFPQITRWLESRQGRGDFVAAVGDRRSEQLLAAIATAAEREDLPAISIPVCGLARLIPDFYRSDHAPFWKCSYPAVMLTDTANFRSPHYHRASDTVDTLDFNFAGKVMRTAFTALQDLAGY